MPKAKVEPALFEVDELAPTPDKVLTDALNTYNEIASRVNVEGKAKLWNQAKLLTDARRKRLKIAIQDCGGLAGWRKVLEDASKNNWLLGKEGRSESHRNWIPDLDFFIQPKTVIKLVEGGYAPSITTPKRLVIPMAYAPRPGQNEKPFVAESQDVRELSMIESYTKHRRYADANRIAQQRADRLGIPAVLIPDPSVAHVGMPPKESAQHAASAVPEKSPAEREADRRRAFEAKNRANATDVPSWLEEDIPADAYRDGP